MIACTEQGCEGTVAADGYCDTCGMAGAPAVAASAGAVHGAPVAATTVAGSACAEAGCSGTIADDGYCDTCGIAALPAPAGPAPVGSAAPPSIAAPSAPGSSGRLAGASRRTRSTRTGSTRTRLGAGLVTVPSTEVGDPAQAIMSPEKIAAVLGEVPEEDRYCSSCGRPVGRAGDGRPGRVQGFCSHCRAPFDFQTNAPTLQAGELVAGQYEILGPLAHGGMGWIYLGRDRAVSDRWVVLKGLLNENDPDAVAAAVAERQFLAQIEHGNIVNIYNFVTHLGRGYIVMEYVGGESLNAKLKARRRANNGVPDPLPPAEAIAYVLGVLPAFGYLHNLGLVYNDLKPANIMAVGSDVKLIDVGAVMRIDDEHAAIFGTQGFQAPEVATLGPSISSDLYTVGRTLAVLVLDFVFHTGPYLHQIPPPREAGILTRWESLHRFLLKATALHPDDRFQDAGEMAEQLTGVLREIVAVTERTPRPGASRHFTGDRLAALLLDAEDAVLARGDWRALPAPRVDEADQAAAFLHELDELAPDGARSLIDAALAGGQVPHTRELRLRHAAVLLALGVDPRPVLDDVAAEDPWEWRVEWYRGVHQLARGEPAAAAEAFSRVWTELPGELAPRLGAALAAESADELARATELYARVVSVDSTYVSAAFGLARCRAALGDRAGAVAAYQQVPPSSATYQEAQVASARALIRGDGATTGPAELRQAAGTVERLQLDAVERASLAAEILERALAAGEEGRRDLGAATLLGHPVSEQGLRRGLEVTYRELARLSTDPAEKIRLVDLANEVRPRTLV